MCSLRFWEIQNEMNIHPTVLLTDHCLLNEYECNNHDLCVCARFDVAITNLSTHTHTLVFEKQQANAELRSAGSYLTCQD